MLKLDKYLGSYGLKRLALLICAIILAWMIMLMMMVGENYDGFPSIILMPIFSGIYAGIQIAISVIVVLALKYFIQNFNQIYNKKVYLSLILISLIIMIFGVDIGLPSVVITNDFQQKITELHPGIWYSLNILLSVLIISFPVQSTRKITNSIAPEK